MSDKPVSVVGGRRFIDDPSRIIWPLHSLWEGYLASTESLKPAIENMDRPVSKIFKDNYDSVYVYNMERFCSLAKIMSEGDISQAKIAYEQLKNEYGMSVHFNPSHKEDIRTGNSYSRTMQDFKTACEKRATDYQKLLEAPNQEQKKFVNHITTYCAALVRVNGHKTKEQLLREVSERDPVLGRFLGAYLRIQAKKASSKPQASNEFSPVATTVATSGDSFAKSA